MGKAKRRAGLFISPEVLLHTELAPNVPKGATTAGQGVVTDMDYMSRITIEPGKRSGKPCIRGLRITVSDVLDYLASGMTEDEILAEFSDLERDDIKACLAFAADRERRLASVPPA